MVSEKNTNGNTNGVSVTVLLPSGESVEALPLADVAQQLEVTLPRLQRVLKRPELAPFVVKADRPTRTGTRTVTVVSISVLDALKEALVDGETEQKRKYSHSEAFVFSPGEAERRHRAALELLTREYSDRIEEQGRTITDLRRDKDELRSEKEKLLGELERERERALLLESELEKLKALPAMEQESQFGLAGGDSGEVSASGGPLDTPGGSEEPKRGFWARLWGKNK